MSQEKTTVGAKVRQDRKDSLSELAKSRSTGDEQVTVSDLVRESINNLLEAAPESEISESVQDSSTTPPSGDFDVSDTSQKTESSDGVYKDESVVNLPQSNKQEGEASDSSDSESTEVRT